MLPFVSLAVAAIDTDAGAVNEAPFVGLDNETTGGVLEAVATVTCRELDVVVAPELSRATAVSVCVPLGALLHVTEYGLLVSDPIGVEPAKNSTAAIVPSVSLALALTVIVAGVV
jgi:hypothetical protein